MKPVWLIAVLAFALGTLMGALGGTLSLDRSTPPAPVAGAFPPTDARVETTEAPGAAGGALVSAGSIGPQGAEAGAAQAAGPEATAPADPPDPRLARALAAWTRAESQLAALAARLALVEEKLARPVGVQVETGAARSAPGREPEPPAEPRTPVERRDALVAAGLEPALAEEMVTREGRISLDRLDLRDRATREGWLDSDRYRAELERLSQESRSMRQEIGESAYDRFLYATGEDNRVRVTSVIAGSSAESAGLEPGDLIESYAGARLYDTGDLRQGTGAGERGELVQVRVRRGSGTLDAWVPRGPLGVRIEGIRVQPGP